MKFTKASSDIYRAITSACYKSFPIVAPSDTKGDFVTYAREKFATGDTDKMSVYGDVYIRVNVFAFDYDTSLKMADKLTDIIVQMYDRDNSKMVSLIDAVEDYDLTTDKYIQSMLFRLG